MLELKAKTLDGDEITFDVSELLGNGDRIDGVFHLEGDLGYIDCLVDTIELVNDRDNNKDKSEIKSVESNTNELIKNDSIKLNPIEKSRTYIFPKGEKVVLINVEELKVSESGNHRLKTSDGKLHIIPTGWIHIEIDTEKWTI